MTADMKHESLSNLSPEELKSQGNKHFSSGNFEDSIDAFTLAIELDPSNHVLYSNRSAAYSSLKKYELALKDAEKTIELKSDWAKGYSRKGAALHGMTKLDEAIAAYQDGLKIDPNNSLLKKGLDEVEADKQSGESNPMGKLFGPDMWSKITTNPKLQPFLAQPDYIEKLNELQSNPSAINKYMQDPRIMNTIMALMGMDSTMFNPDKDEPMPQADEIKTEPKAEPKSEQKPEPKIEEVVEETEAETNRRKSNAEKDLGNAEYKQKKFDEAISHYDAAFELDKTNVAVLTNKSAALFEAGRFEDCIKVCDQAVEVGREHYADFKIIAKAYNRMGNAYAKMNDLVNAIKYLEKSLSEHRTPDTLSKLRELEKLKVNADKEAYRNPQLSDEARERGNVLFKQQLFADAVKEYTESIKRNDADPRNYSNRAACYNKLMALPEAEKDCDKAIELDPKFVKAYIRKAAILFAKREFTKAMDVCNEAKSIDTEGKHTAELDGQITRCYAALNTSSNQTPEEVQRNAQNNPEVQQILSDPVMQQILKDMQENPGAAQDHLKNPMIATKIRTLINAGILRVK